MRVIPHVVNNRKEIPEEEKEEEREMRVSECSPGGENYLR